MNVLCTSWLKAEDRRLKSDLGVDRAELRDMTEYFIRRGVVEFGPHNLAKGG